MAVKVRGPDNEVTTSTDSTVTFPVYHLISQAFLFLGILTWQFKKEEEEEEENGRKQR